LKKVPTKIDIFLATSKRLEEKIEVYSVNVFLMALIIPIGAKVSYNESH